MGIGTGLFLIAVGAIMRFAVETDVEGFSINTAGLILMVIGAIGLLLSLIWMLRATDRGATVVERRDVYSTSPDSGVACVLRCRACSST